MISQPVKLLISLVSSALIGALSFIVFNGVPGGSSPAQAADFLTQPSQHQQVQNIGTPHSVHTAVANQARLVAIRAERAADQEAALDRRQARERRQDAIQAAAIAAAAQARQQRQAARQAAQSSPPPASSPPAPSGGGIVSFAGLEALWVGAGGPAAVEYTAAQIAECESGGNPNAYNPSGASGLWQILGNPFPGNPFDPVTNAAMAVAKYRGAGNSFTPWVCQ